ncbi:MAG: riboflavin synthase, partial [Bacteroidia bacterium]
TSIENNNYTVTAIHETLNKTNLSELKVGDYVNIERCMPANGRFDGHVVQGHIDTTGVCKDIKDLNGSFEFSFEYAPNQNHFTVEKGSITINGVSLTVVNSKDNSFSVHIIPFTLEHTNFKTLKIGDKVNLEFDIIGKYVSKLLNPNKK